MLRLAPPGFERFLQSPEFVATFGGGEANVAVALSGFGAPAAYVTVLPANPLGDAVVGELRRFGVDTSKIVRGQGPAGRLFRRGGRQPAALQGGLRPRELRHRARQAGRHRLGQGLRRRRLVPHHRHHARHQRQRRRRSPSNPSSKAREKGLTVSCDLNYRKNLWKWGKPAAEVMRELVQLRRYRHRQRRGLPEGARHRGRRGRPLRPARPREVLPSSPRRCWASTPT